ncbi:MAG: efflux RND transporter periplasmic adaptor subunit [Alphaproteobacteria bacterium]|nr:efflux RND transporter periplasmic adaptor subunit [Alphaproteobacteria bacterium]
MKTPHAIAIGLTGLLVLWMGAGMLFKGQPPAAKSQETAQAAPGNAMVVEVRAQTAQPVTGYITAQGHVMPDREVIIRAEAEAQVKKILIKEGNSVKTGDILAKLDMNDRQIRLEKARAKTAEEQRKYNSAKNLAAKGYTAKTRTDETLAALKAAQAEEKQIALEIENTNIKAPFDGIIDHQNIEKGAYVRIGDEVFTLVDNDPLVVTVYVPQHEIAALETGGKAEIKLATGQDREGTIRFIAPRAEQATRTFRVEAQIANPDNLPSGTSASVRIPRKSVLAHFASPALLSLDKKGATGIKTVNENGIVEFYPVQIISAKPGGIYVTGLPERARIIVNGQGFVAAGEKVSYVSETEKTARKETLNEDH